MAERRALERATALVVGVGGLGAPAALALARAGVGRLLLADDDRVEWSNLHRQLLFTEADVGQPKLEAAARGLRRLLPDSPTEVELIASRLLPENARRLVAEADVVLEGADNFATKFLAADACHVEKRPVVHGAAIRWRATVFAVAPAGAPCYRCLFEELPGAEASENCASAGVMGPVPGLAGALMADLALGWLVGGGRDERAWGAIHTYDGRTDRLRRVTVGPRADCPLCGARPTLLDVSAERYAPPPC